MNDNTANKAGNEFENEQIEIARKEDVEFSEALADSADLEAAERAQEADNRQENG